MLKMKSVYILLILTCLSSVAAESSYEKEIIQSVNSLRSISPTSDQEKLKTYNEMMDNNWSVFSKDKSDSVPIIVRILEEEIQSKEPNHLVLLDLGYFIALSDKKSERTPIILKVYEKIDPKQPIVSANSQQYFQFSLFLSYRQTPGLLGLIDERFLRSEAKAFFIPQHVISVDGHGQRTFLYGVYGKESVPHLLGQLVKTNDVKIKRSITSILRRICTPECAQGIFEFLKTEKDHENFVNGTYILLDNAGPKGRELYLELKPENLPAKTSEYFKSEQEYARNQTYEFLLSKIERKFGKSTNQFSKSELIDQIELMIRNKGASRTIHPIDILKSSVDREILIEKLIEARRNCFLRTNQHGLEDIDITNLILNVLYFEKEKKNEIL